MVKNNVKYLLAIMFIVFSVSVFINSCAPKKPKVDQTAIMREQQRAAEEARLKAEEEERRKFEEAIKIEQERKAAEEEEKRKFEEAIKIEQERKAAEEEEKRKFEEAIKIEQERKAAEEARLKAEEEGKRGIEEEKLKEEEEIKPQIAREAEVKVVPQLDDIHFDFDKSDIRTDAREILQKNADWLQNNPDIKIQIEGHCDERGTAEYNLALGERRAMSTKKYLISLGISADRIYTISYGEELPIDPNHSEDSWAKNRRAHFLVITK